MMELEWNMATFNTIKIKYLTDIDKIDAAHEGEWIDLRCAEDTYFSKGEAKLIPLGVKMQLPVGYEAVVVPRSSTFKRYHILQSNHLGVIDNQYRGQWMFPAYAVDQTFVPKNDRICQFRIQKTQGKIAFEEVDELDETDRGDGGFGSTGEK